MNKKNKILIFTFIILTVIGSIFGFNKLKENKTILNTPEYMQCLYGCPISKNKKRINLIKRTYINLK